MKKSLRNCEKPIEGKWFAVNPKNIDRRLFEEKREDSQQEWTRKQILEAFKEIKQNPKRYEKGFETLMPKKTWNIATFQDLEELAYEKGDGCADWIVQAVEWAQRIQNGETWEELCNMPDTANWCRLILWKDECPRIVGASRQRDMRNSATEIFPYSCSWNDRPPHVVPLIVRFKDTAHR